MRTICIGALFVATAVTVWAASPAAQSPLPARHVALTFNGGKVTLIAQGVTVRDVMAEWTRQCGCLVRGTERLPAAPMPPVEFDDQPEAVVLASLLRGAGGYLLGPRAENSHGASIYGSVTVFPVTKGIAASTYTSSAPIAAPLVTGPDDEIPPVTPVANPQTPAQTPAPQPGRPGGPAAGSSNSPPGRPGGPAVPISPVPGQTTGSTSSGSL